MSIAELIALDPIAAALAFGTVGGILFLVVGVIVWICKDPDHKPGAVATGHHARSVTAARQAGYPAMQTVSDGGLACPSGQCTPSRNNCLTAGQQAAYHLEHETQMLARYEHAASMYADPQQPEPAQAPEPVSEPVHVWRNDQDLQQPPAPVVQQYIPLDLEQYDEPAPAEDYTEAQVDSNRDLVYVRIGRG